MKRKLKATLSLILVLSLVFLAASPALAATDPATTLSFNSEGKFKIIQFTDTQDDNMPREAMIRLMNKALDAENPDLVVFTGDNITGGGSPGKVLTSIAIKAIIKPVASRGIPFAMVFGNHDAEGGISKETQLTMYQKYPGCLAYDPEPDLYGCATYNLPIRSSDNSKDAFNLWLIDSNESDRVNGGYDRVHQDQLDWYKSKSIRLEQANGGLVPSLMFQHIVVPEVYELLKEVPAGTEGSRSRFGKTWALELNPDRAQGTLGEWPCPPDINGGQFQAVLERGDVLGIVTGHDHVNDFVGSYKGVDFIQTPGIGFQTYGSRDRGFRVIILDENDSWHYETYTPTFFDYFGTGLAGEFAYAFFGSPVATFLPLLGDIIYAILKTFS
ncbi:MAG TPA: metallophosphoesterase family protein [Clostridia bacterium]|nr:metallophosphoesterase family protein [Clostridia bacterium]